MKKTIVFDFDGVIHRYSQGWKDGSIYDGPIEGIKELIDELRATYKIVIVSTRCSSEAGRRAIMQWLDKYNIIVDECTDIKVPAIIYVDDRAIQFDGKVDDLRREIRTFRTWQDKHNMLF